MKTSSLPASPSRRGSGPRAATARLLVVTSCMAATAAHAQEGGSGRISWSASVGAELSYVVDSRKGGLKGGVLDLVSEVRPGLRFSSRSGRIVGSLDYSMGLTHHTQDYDGERVQNRLNASLSAEAVERWMYVDASASVSQQTASAFGQQSAPDSTQDNANRIEIANASLSPYVRGVLGSAVNYEARLNASATNGRRSKAADSSQTGGSFNLSSAVGGTYVGWALVASTQTSDFRLGRETQNDRYSASLSFTPDADLSFTLRGGQESTNVADVQKTVYDNWGAGLTWRPSPRTSARLDTDERYFGRSYRVLLEHRMASSSLQFSSSRDSSNSADPSGAGQRITLYQVFFAQFASIEPDPNQRDTLVRSFLQAQGLDPDLVVSGGFVNTAVTVVEQHQLTLSYAGQRMAGSVQAFASTSRIVDAAATAAALDDTRQWGYVATASYRLSPTASVALTGSRLLTQATSAQGGTELKSLSLSYGDQLARRTSMSLSARYSVFNSTLNPYREAAVSASLSQRF